MTIIKTAQTSKGRYRIQLEREKPAKRAYYSIRVYRGANTISGFVGIPTKAQAEKFFISILEDLKGSRNYKII